MKRAGSVLFMGSMGGSLLAYLFFVILARALQPGGLGAVGALVNVFAITMVPGLGLQLVAARRIAPLADDEHAVRRHVARTTVFAALLVGAVVAVVLAGVSAPLADALHLDSLAPVLGVVGSAVPMTVTYAVIGLLQGQERFARVGAAYLGIGVARAGSAVLAVVTSSGPTGVMAWFAAGWFAIALASLGLLRTADGASAPTHDSAGTTPEVNDPWSTPGAAVIAADAGLTKTIRAGLVAAVPMSGLLILTSMDLLLARHFLSRADSGAYTVGALFEKVAFWGPSFIATLYYPAMSRPSDRRNAIRRALTVTIAIGAVGIALAALLGTPLVTLVGGSEFSWLGPTAWIFTAVGVGFAVAQVLVYADLAGGHHGVGYAVWLAAATAAALVWTTGHHSTTAVITSMGLAVAGLVLLALVIVRWSARSRSTL